MTPSTFFAIAVQLSASGVFLFRYRNVFDFLLLVISALLTLLADLRYRRTLKSIRTASSECLDNLAAAHRAELAEVQARITSVNTVVNTARLRQQEPSWQEVYEAGQRFDEPASQSGRRSRDERTDKVHRSSQ